MDILVSVIVPNYNHAAFLEKRITSVLDQTYSNFEVIILDDCSTDNSRDIIEQYRQHEKVKHIVYNEINGGTTFSQWIKGIELATGNYIWIAESDDYCDKIFLEDLIGQLQPDTAVAYCQSNYIDADDRLLYRSGAQRIYQHMAGNDFIGQHMLYGNAIFNASMCIWKKDCFKNLSPEFLNYKFCGDWIFWTELAAQGDVLISGKALNYYRRHEQSVSTNSNKQDIALEEELLAVGYLHVFNAAYRQNLREILFYKVKQYHNNGNFNAIYKKVCSRYPFLKFPFVKEKIAALKLDDWVSKMKRLWRG